MVFSAIADRGIGTPLRAVIDLPQSGQFIRARCSYTNASKSYLAAISNAA
jgi:hypothetical protein